MKLIALAKSLKPFLQKDITLEGIYKEILTNNSLPFKSMLTPFELVKLVFITKKILLEDNPNIESEIDNNVFVFSTITFEDSNQQIDCDNCYNDGYINCDLCDGSGEVDCDECGGEGEIESSDGEDYETCGECQGNGKVTCPDCDGNGSVDCDYCDGNGYIETDDYIPYEINYFISYDNNLKTTFESKMLRNDIENPKWNPSKTFLLYIDTVGPKEGESENIDEDFANNDYFLEIETEDIPKTLLYGNNKVMSSAFYDDLSKFSK